MLHVRFYPQPKPKIKALSWTGGVFVLFNCLHSLWSHITVLTFDCDVILSPFQLIFRFSGVMRKIANGLFLALYFTHRQWWPECWRRTWRMPSPSLKKARHFWGWTRRACWPSALWQETVRGTPRWRSSGSETPASALQCPAAVCPPPAARCWRKPGPRTAGRWYKTLRNL